MHKWTKEWVNEEMHKWTKEWVNEEMHKWTKEWVNEEMHKWTKEWVNEEMHKWTKEWVNEEMHKWMKEWVNEEMHKWMKVERRKQASKQNDLTRHVETIKPGYKRMALTCKVSRVGVLQLAVVWGTTQTQTTPSTHPLQTWKMHKTLEVHSTFQTRRAEQLNLNHLVLSWAKLITATSLLIPYHR